MKPWVKGCIGMRALQGGLGVELFVKVPGKNPTVSSLSH